MSVESYYIESALCSKCSNCYSKMTLPTWVSMEEEADKAIFQCPVCSSEAEIDIRDYPKVGVRVVVNEWKNSVHAQGSY